jgi:hypothetical protein
MPFPPVIPKIDLSKPPDPFIDPAGYLRSINAVRERSALVLEKAKRNELEHFKVDMSLFPHTTKFVVSIIKVRGCSTSGCRGEQVANISSEPEARLCP